MRLPGIPYGGWTSTEKSPNGGGASPQVVLIRPSRLPPPQGSSQCRPSEALHRDPCFSPSVTAFFKTPKSEEPMWVLEG